MFKQNILGNTQQTYISAKWITYYTFVSPTQLDAEQLDEFAKDAGINHCLICSEKIYQQVHINNYDFGFCLGCINNVVNPKLGRHLRTGIQFK